MMEAGELLPAGRVYTLTVSERAFVYARHLLQEMAASTKDNPFAPYVNLQTSREFGRDEWCLSLGEDAVGSVGA